MASLDSSEMMVITELNDVVLGFSSSFIEEIFKVRSFYRSPFHDTPLMGIHVRTDGTLVPLFDLNQIMFSTPIEVLPKKSDIFLGPRGMECLIITIKNSKVGLVCKHVKSVVPKRDLIPIEEKDVPNNLKQNLPPQGVKNFLKDEKSSEIIVEVHLSDLLPIEPPEKKQVSPSDMLENEDDDDNFDISQYTLPG